jgi:hypothetical protein
LSGARKLVLNASAGIAAIAARRFCSAVVAAVTLPTRKASFTMAQPVSRRLRFVIDWGDLYEPLASSNV